LVAIEIIIHPPACLILERHRMRFVLILYSGVSLCVLISVETGLHVFISVRGTEPAECTSQRKA
jgi:hypothetical protein